MTLVDDQDSDARTAWRVMTEIFLNAEVHHRAYEAGEAVSLPHPGALRLLLRLEADDAPAMRDLAAFMTCDASWVTALVDALEAPGYVIRVVSPTDRRVRLVQLTEAGKAARQRAKDVLATPPKYMDRLTADETKTLARILQKLCP